MLSRERGSVLSEEAPAVDGSSGATGVGTVVVTVPGEVCCCSSLSSGRYSRLLEPLRASTITLVTRE